MRVLCHLAGRRGERADGQPQSKELRGSDGGGSACLGAHPDSVDVAAHAACRRMRMPRHRAPWSSSLWAGRSRSSLPLLPCPTAGPLPRLASPCLALPRLALPCLALPCLALPCLALPRLASPRLASPRLASPRLASCTVRTVRRPQDPVPCWAALTNTHSSALQQRPRGLGGLGAVPLYRTYCAPRVPASRVLSCTQQGHRAPCLPLPSGPHALYVPPYA